MQAEIPPTLKRNNTHEQSSKMIACPLCHTPLVTRGIPSDMPSKAHQTVVTCPSCGYSAPYVQRQQRINENVSAQRPSVGSSVWIDPAVSAYLGSTLGNPRGPVRSAQPAKPTQSAHKKPSASQPSPITPIPQRASAQHQHPNAVKVRPKYGRAYTHQQDNDVTRIPTLPPPTMWQYESPQFAAESSLPSLSLVIEAPTQPPPPPSTISAKSLLELPESIDELDTRPPTPKQHIANVDELDTLPGQLIQLSPASTRSTNIDNVDTLPPKSGQQITDIDKINTLPPVVIPSVSPKGSSKVARIEPTEHASPRAVSVLAAATPTKQVAAVSDPSSWTAGGVRESAYARRIADRASGRKHLPKMQPIDHVRRWLLQPGRLEGVLWLGGSFLLIIVTFALLMVTALSFSWITTDMHSGTISSSTNVGTTPTGMPTLITTHGLTIILENSTLLVPGQAIQLRGQGCSSSGQIVFTDDKRQPLPLQGSQSNAVQADAHGVFAATLSTYNWAVGIHQILVRDVVSGRVADLPLILNAGPFGKNATPTTPTNGLTTPTVSNGGGFPTAVSSTPAPIKTPTFTPSPTSTPVTPTATPTKEVTPTNTPGVTPTVGTTPTPGTTPTTSGASGQSKGTIATAGSASLVANGTNAPLSPWIYLLIVGYSLAMLMLGFAGVLYKRQN